MKQVSKRRAARDSVYAQRRRDVFERADGRCEAMIADDCTFACEQVHHRAGRGGDDPHAMSNLIGLCDPCHRWAHSNPAGAVEAGISRSRHRYN